VEFLKRAEILRQFGPSGSRSFSQAYGRIGAITDDTQMSLFTAEAVIRASCQSPELEQSTVERELTSAYLRWLSTQWPTEPTDIHAFGDRSGLFAIEALHALRAPGSTCVSALKAIGRHGKRPWNDSKGCGGVMRVAPIGIACSGTPDGTRKAFHLGVVAAAITHGHPTGQLAAGALAMTIANLIDGHTLGQALANAHLVLSEQPASEETTSALQRAMRLAASEPNSPEAVRKLGEGWIAEEALAIAVYCALSAPDLPSALFLAINHDGDSDSTGSITGNLVGCLYGQALTRRPSCSSSSCAPSSNRSPRISSAAASSRALACSMPYRSQLPTDDLSRPGGPQ
jgi:ADP-ribosylglycohydrolase